MQFTGFPKMSRLSREMVITEKIDGTNAQVYIERRDAIAPELLANPVAPFLSLTQGDNDFVMLAGSRTRWISALDDNFGFGRWVSEHRDELLTLGPGSHFGEWWGQGIQRKYGLAEKRFSLFNVHRWADPAVRPACCHVVPTLYKGAMDTAHINSALTVLRALGSQAAPGFMKPEGIVIFHTAAGICFKKTIEDDEVPKTQAKKAA